VGQCNVRWDGVGWGNTTQCGPESDGARARARAWVWASGVGVGMCVGIQRGQGQGCVRGHPVRARVWAWASSMDMCGKAWGCVLAPSVSSRARARVRNMVENVSEKEVTG
jgi:hypothetical protein